MNHKSIKNGTVLQSNSSDVFVLLEDIFVDDYNSTGMYFKKFVSVYSFCPPAGIYNMPTREIAKWKLICES